MKLHSFNYHDFILLRKKGNKCVGTYNRMMESDEFRVTIVFRGHHLDKFSVFRSFGLKAEDYYSFHIFF